VEHNQLTCPISCQRFQTEASQKWECCPFDRLVQVFFHIVNVGNDEVKGCKLPPANLSLSKEIIKSNGC
jgi:hypothetical protein